MKKFFVLDIDYKSDLLNRKILKKDCLIEKNFMIKELLSKFNSKNFKVGVIGLGYVGLPICERFSRVGVEVIGVDNDPNKIKTLKKRIVIYKSNKLKNFRYFRNNKKNLSTNYRILSECEAILICLPTPLKNSKPDMWLYFFVLRN